MDIQKVDKPILAKVLTDSSKIKRSYIYIKQRYAYRFQKGDDVLIQKVKIVKDKIRIHPEVKPKEDLTDEEIINNLENGDKTDDI